MAKIRNLIHETPLKQSSTINRRAGFNVYLKLENLQRTGSFKVRGALNKVLSLSTKELERGVIAASAGNHAQGVALACKLRNAQAYIYMPVHTPETKIKATRAYGAKVILAGNTYDEAYAHALQHCVLNNHTFVHAFDDEDVIAGQGTLALEMLKQNPNLDTLVAPVGGGGLISGVAIAAKRQNPSIKIVGVQAASVPGVHLKFNRSRDNTGLSWKTMAEGIQVRNPGSLTYPLIEEFVDEIVTVTEKEIADTILFMLEREKLLVEGAGAVAVAAVLHGHLNHLPKEVGCIVSGGNLDYDKLRYLSSKENLIT